MDALAGIGALNPAQQAVKAQTDAVTRDYIAEPHLGEGLLGV